jgi:hypothetical protein
MLELIKDQAQTDWRAAAWVLERRFPEDFSLKREVDLQVNKSNGTNEVIEFLKRKGLNPRRRSSPSLSHLHSL